ncbi:MAG: pseudaminic acid cytidylyltransferase [Saprospiraceae bacterium]
MKKIAIIPARGGSKRIPRKNIKSFLGKPIIAYSIEAALSSNLFDEVMVSTEDEEIAVVARKYGAKVPFVRSEKNSDDFTGTGDVCFEVLNAYKTKGISFDLACCIYATAPLIHKDRLSEALDLLVNNKAFDVTLPAGRFSSPILRSYKMDETGGIGMHFPQYEKSRSQDLPEAYFDAGQFYWFHTSNMESLANKNIFGENKGAVILEDYEVQDIDEISDWDMAELKFSYLEKIKSI